MGRRSISEIIEDAVSECGLEVQLTEINLTKPLKKSNETNSKIRNNIKQYKI